MVGVMIKVALKFYWNQRNAQKLQHFPLIWVDSDWMTLLVLTFKTSSTLFLCSPSPNAASSTKMGSHIESYASISLCFILAYRASSLWTTFPTSHCNHTKSALLLKGNCSLPHSEGKGVLYCFAMLLFLLTLAAEWDWKGRLWHHSQWYFQGALPFENRNMEIKYKPVIASAFTLSEPSLRSKVETQLYISEKRSAGAGVKSAGKGHQALITASHWPWEEK